MSGLVEGLQLTLQADIATIVLNHPERANALDPAEFHALAALLASVGEQSGLRAIVLTGAGERAFCAGLNLSDSEAIRHDLASSGPTGLGAVLRTAAALPVPLLARINGACVAGGMGLLGACDYALATTTARFGLPEIRHGIYPYVAMSGLHGRAPHSLLSQLADSGTLIDAATALEAGLIDALHLPEALDAEMDLVLKRLRDGIVPERTRRRLHEGTAAVERRVAEADAAARQAAQ